MRRRDFIAAFAGATAPWPWAAGAQSGNRRIGVLTTSDSLIKADIGTGPYDLRRNSSGSLAIFAAIRRASSSIISPPIPPRPVI